MRTPILLLALAAGLALTTRPVSAADSAMPSIQHPTIPPSQTDAHPPPANPPPASNAAVVPGAGFPAARYEVLWTKSPFAVATSEAAVDTSPDYLFVGFANVDGISYASVIDVHSQEHFLISTNKPTRGLTLTSITRSHDTTDTYAQVLKDGQTIALKLEQAPVSAPGNLAIPGMNMPNQISMPGASSFYPGIQPRVRFHRPLIHLPPTPPTPQPPPQPAQ